MATEIGAEDFLSSRDLHGNTTLHYIALFDQEDFIDAIFLKLSKKENFAQQLKDMTEIKNSEGRSPMDFFKLGKTDSYELL